MLRIWSMNFCSLTTRGPLLTTWTLALHYCCTSSDYSSHHANTANACPGDQNVNPDQLVTTPSDPVSLAKPHMPVRSMPLGPQRVPRPSSQQKPVSLPSFCKKHLSRGPKTSANSFNCNVQYCQHATGTTACPASLESAEACQSPKFLQKTPVPGTRNLSKLLAL